MRRYANEPILGLNGTAVDVQASGNSGTAATVLGAHGIARVPAGATIRMRVFHNTGADLNTANNGSIGCAYLAAQWLSP